MLNMSIWFVGTVLGRTNDGESRRFSESERRAAEEMSGVRISCWSGSVSLVSIDRPVARRGAWDGGVEVTKDQQKQARSELGRLQLEEISTHRIWGSKWGSMMDRRCCMFLSMQDESCRTDDTDGFFQFNRGMKMSGLAINRRKTVCSRPLC